MVDSGRFGRLERLSHCSARRAACLGGSFLRNPDGCQSVAPPLVEGPTHRCGCRGAVGPGMACRLAIREVGVGIRGSGGNHGRHARRSALREKSWVMDLNNEPTMYVPDRRPPRARRYSWSYPPTPSSAIEAWRYDRLRVRRQCKPHLRRARRHPAQADGENGSEVPGTKRSHRDLLLDPGRKTRPRLGSAEAWTLLNRRNPRACSS